MGNFELNKTYKGDARELIKGLADKSIDLCLTDFPYGIGEHYKSWDDTQDNLQQLITELMPEILRVSQRAVITCGVSNMFYFPKPNWVDCWYIPAGVGRTPYGFNCWQPILIYGKCPTVHLGCQPDVLKHIEISEVNGHPCPKPINLWRKLLVKYSLNKGETVLDTFMGSGTTAIACLKDERNFIGFELEQDYIDITENRIDLFNSQPSLFFGEEKKIIKKDLQAQMFNTENGNGT